MTIPSFVSVSMRRQTIERSEIMIDYVVRHPPIPKASELLIPLLPDEEPSLDKAITLCDMFMKERGLYCTPSFLLDVWMKKRKEK